MKYRGSLYHILSIWVCEVSVVVKKKKKKKKKEFMPRKSHNSAIEFINNVLDIKNLFVAL